MSDIINLISSNFLTAAGWTVLHTIWMGVVVFLLVMLMQHIGARQNAARRYQLAFAGQVITLFLAIGVFSYYFTQPIGPGLDEVFFSGAAATFHEDYTPFFQQLKYTIASNAPTIALIWMAGVLVLLLRMAFGIRYIHTMKKSSWIIADEKINNIVDNLRAKLNLSISCDIRTTEKFTSPLLTGFVRPFIMMPIAVINSLDIKEVELILAHELAHLKRYDHIALIVQQVIETILYFNPTTWLLSAQINRYREEACDDLVVDTMGDQFNYAKSLVKLQDLHAGQQHGLALFALGRKNQLLNRIKRILNMENNRRFHLGHLSLVLLLPLAFVLLSFYSKQQSNKKAEVTKLESLLAKVDFEQAPLSVDTIPVRKNRARVIEKVIKKENGREVEAEFENDELIQLRVDGQEIDTDNAGEYQEVVDDLRGELNNNSTDKKVYKWRTDGEGDEENIEFDFDFEELGSEMEDIFDGLGENMGDLFEGLGDNLQGYFETFEFDDTGDGMTLKIDGETLFEMDSDGDQFIIRSNGEEFDLDNLMDKLAIEADRFEFKMEDLESKFPEVIEDGDKIILRFDGSEDQIIFDESDIAKWEDKAERLAKKYEAQAERWAERFEDQMEDRAERMEERTEKMRERENHARDHRKEMERHFDRSKDLQKREMRESRGNESRNHFWSGKLTLQQRIEKELKNDGFMSGSNNYSFKLKENKLKINGKRQPDDVYEKYKRLYERYSGSQIEGSSYSTSNTGI